MIIPQYLRAIALTHPALDEIGGSVSLLGKTKRFLLAKSQRKPYLLMRLNLSI
jgi:hypothetical protein